jgi:hypothetical protein
LDGSVSIDPLVSAIAATGEPLRSASKALPASGSERCPNLESNSSAPESGRATRIVRGEVNISASGALKRSLACALAGAGRSDEDGDSTFGGLACR